MGMNSARYAIGDFDIKLGDNVFCIHNGGQDTNYSGRSLKERTRVDASLTDISDSSTLDHVPHSVTLDGLIFANAARTVRAAHECDVAAAFLVAAAISSFLCLKQIETMSIAAKIERHPDCKCAIHPVPMLVRWFKRCSMERRYASCRDDSPCWKVLRCLEDGSNDEQEQQTCGVGNEIRAGPTSRWQCPEVVLLVSIILLINLQILTLIITRCRHRA